MRVYIYRESYRTIKKLNLLGFKETSPYWDYYYIMFNQRYSIRRTDIKPGSRCTVLSEHELDQIGLMVTLGIGLKEATISVLTLRTT